MDLNAIAGMLFVLIMLGMILGFILVIPLTRRLTRFLEQLLHQRFGTMPADDVRRLEAAVVELQRELRVVTERQRRAEALLADRERMQLSGSTPAIERPV
jgi:hypothetical protein